MKPFLLMILILLVGINIQCSPTTNDNSVLLWIDGKPAITLSQYQDYAGAVIKAQPQLNQLMTFMPNIDYELFQQMVNEIIIQDWIKENKIDKTVDYQKEKKKGIDLIEKQLAVKYFRELYPKRNNIQISDADVRKAYEKQFRNLLLLPVMQPVKKSLNMCHLKK